MLLENYVLEKNIGKSLFGEVYLEIVANGLPQKNMIENKSKELKQWNTLEMKLKLCKD